MFDSFDFIFSGDGKTTHVTVRTRVKRFEHHSFLLVSRCSLSSSTITFIVVLAKDSYSKQKTFFCFTKKPLSTIYTSCFCFLLFEVTDNVFFVYEISIFKHNRFQGIHKSCVVNNLSELSVKVYFS